MGETKKRRQTKHRGNAAGMVESRGRNAAGRMTTEAAKVDSRGVRIQQPPSWQRAVFKAFVPALILVPFLFLTQKGSPIGGKIVFIVLAFILYIPMSYYIDRWAYNRYMKQKNG